MLWLLLGIEMIKVAEKFVEARPLDEFGAKTPKLLVC
jgi:hypothetical protein